MISKISLAMNKQQGFGQFFRNSRKNIENSLSEYYKSTRSDGTLKRSDEANLEYLNKSFLEVNAYKIEDTNDLYVSIYNPVTQADYYTGNIPISGCLTDILRAKCNIAERSRYDLT